MADTITWSVSGGTKAGTKIDQTGKLDVDATETVGAKLTVTAKATVDSKELSGTATATVTTP